jgi:para-nitrobenzyl esterase
MLTSSMARGLFRRAILQSAGLPTARAGTLPLRDLATAESIAVDYARSLGIEGDGEAALAALRLAFFESLRMTRGQRGLLFFLTVGDFSF